NLLIGGPSFFDAGLMLCNLIMAQGGRVHLISYKSPLSHKSQAQKNRPNSRFFLQRLGLGARRERWLTEAKISEQAECS
ncbi:MAG: hypothetical protein CMI07_07755, partial [Oceanospirillaceae bacterium]|nr:hypothetical protein [Oceanospirillaceae bacterium]